MIQKIAYFDGFCNLCNGFANAILLRRGRHEIHIASLQGETARKNLPDNLRTDLRTLVFFDGVEYWTESTAALKILREMGGVWNIMVIGMILPQAFLDMIYRWVAKNRYAFFGRRETCRIPTPEEKTRFLP